MIFIVSEIPDKTAIVSALSLLIIKNLRLLRILPSFILMKNPPFNYRSWLGVYKSVVCSQTTLPNDDFRVSFVGIKSQVTFTFGEIKQYAIAEIQQIITV